MKASAVFLTKSFPLSVFGGIALVMLISFGVTLALYAFDPRILENQESVWSKPLKFELALALHAFALFLVVDRLDPALRDGRWMQFVALVFLVASAIEMGYIIFQAARAEPSHFNDASIFHQLMFSVMAFCAIFIIGVAGAIGLTVVRDGRFRASSPIRLGVILALTGGTILTLITAFAIGANGSSYVGAMPALGERMSFTGWSKIGGDLRVAHFLATHMIQIIPLVAIAVSFLTRPWISKGIVLGSTGVWVTWTFVEFLVAKDGNVSHLVNVVSSLSNL